MERKNRAIASLGESWGHFIQHEFNKPYIAKIGREVNRLRKLTTVYPSKEAIFRAFKLTPFKDVRVVIVGQDPYYNGQADGLAFSTHQKVMPASLSNILKEIEDDLGIDVYDNPDLTRWAVQDVFLINTTLTVNKGQPGSHSRLGWNRFTGKVLKGLSLSPVPTVFMLWGSHARGLKHLIDPINHLILESSHPSPRSADKGFLGCRHFSKCNTFLTNNNLNPINWK